MSDDAIVPLAEPTPAPPAPSRFEWIFFGKDGLRAGWSLLIYIALLAAVFACVNLVGHAVHPPPPKGAKTPAGPSSVPLMATNEALAFISIFLVTWIMSKIERRPNGVYGLGGSRKVAHLLAGLMWGVTCISILVATLMMTGLLVVEGRLLFGAEIIHYGAMWLAVFVLVGFLEEYLMRGYLLYTLSRGLSGLYQWALKTERHATLGFWTSAVALSILFGLGHRGNPGESPIGLLSAGSAGMVFCYSLWRTGSLWWAIGFHAAWDWGQSFLYGVADSGVLVPHRLLATHPVGRPILSGGSTGPEGSILVVVILALACLIIYLTLPRVQTGHNSAVPQTLT